MKALLAAAEHDPRPFDVVVMAADDRLMRDQWKSAMVLSRLHEAEVRSSTTRKIAKPGSTMPSGRFMEGVRGFAAEMYRESGRAHMVDALKRKAKAGYVTGGCVFGYDNLRVDGHVERRINAAEAAVVRQIFACMPREDAEEDRRGAAEAHAPTPARSAGWTGTAWTKFSD